MAGVRLMDGKVDLIFINNRFAYKARGLFRNVLNSESPDDIRKILGKEDYGDENVMGAVLNYDKQGFVVNYLGERRQHRIQLTAVMQLQFNFGSAFGPIPHTRMPVH